jgi:hypothetical protein
LHGGHWAVPWGMIRPRLHQAWVRSGQITGVLELGVVGIVHLGEGPPGR